MKQNETLKQMLAEYHPELGDGENYMRELEIKLAAVDAVKQLYTAERRRQRRHLVVSFLSGGLSGVLLTIYFLLHPVSVFSESIETCYLIMAELAHFANLITSILLAATLSVGIAVASTQCYGIIRKELAW